MSKLSNSKQSAEQIYNILESGLLENNSIRKYALPNARQWLGGRFFALWVLPIFIINKTVRFVRKSTFVRPYTPSRNGPKYKKPETLHTSLRYVFNGQDKLNFFDHRFIGIWIIPFALTGIVFEILFVAPTKGVYPFN
tara:strand:+ start:95 stop:508 length:414 start_codon:yes stop_codon:yes gene_type:complete